MYEFFKAISKKSKPVSWVGYLVCISIAFIHIIPMEHLGIAIAFAISAIILLLFLHVILSKMNTNFTDIAYTFFGIVYIPVFLMFFALVSGMNDGKILIWYLIISSWATDIFAYIVGRHFGKHKFSTISPKKTIEGCVAGTIGAIIIVMIYTYIVNQYFGADYAYPQMALVALVLSVISQIGDFAASTIKRYVDIKDYGELIPGHGGMLDRIDSLLFVAPFAYVIFTIF